jgi:hypothetical protein
MEFIIDADLPRQSAVLFRAAGHEAIDVRDIGTGQARDAQIAEYALRHRLCIVTGDFDFADVRNYPPEEYAGLVVLELHRNTTAPMILSLLGDLLKKPQVLERLPGRLAIVASGRIRLRPA